MNDGVPLSTRLKEAIESIDIAKEPLKVSNGAKRLSEVQRWERKGGGLEGEVKAFEQSAASPETAFTPTSLADWAFEVLRKEGGAMPYREIAAVIREQGFEHSREPKNPEKQLADSVWTAMYEDHRFTKVGRGIFDLTERLS